MKIKIQIDLAPLPYEHDISPLTGYLHMIISEITRTQVKLNVNDIDFTDKVSIFKQLREPSVFNR
jgi:hypothetical protein